LNHAVERESVEEPLTGGGAVLRAPLGVGDYARQAIAQGGRVSRRRQETRDAVLHRFRNAAHARRHHGKARAHGFENGIRERFEAGGEHQRLRLREMRGDVGLKAAEAHAAGDAQLPGHGADGAFERPIADQVQRPFHVRQARQRS
jgi:hypothetical protein